MLPEEKRQLFTGLRNIQLTDAGIRVTGGKQRRFPADQRRKTTQVIHQPVR